MSKGFKKTDLIIPIIGCASWVVAIPTAFVVGTVIKPQPQIEETFEVDIDIPEGKDIHFSNTEAKLGEEFTSEVTSDIEITDVTITVSGKVLIKDTDYIFRVKNTNNFAYELTIFAHAVTSQEISIDVVVQPPIADITITFDACGGTVEGQEKTTRTFKQDLTWAEIEKPATPIHEPYTFNHWSLIQGGPVIDNGHTFNEGDSVYAVYEHEEDYSLLGYDEEHHKFYKECSICGKQVDLTDEELAQYKNQYLIKNDHGYLETAGTSMTAALDSFESGQHVDLYLTNGLFKWSERSDYANVDVTIHGTEDSQGRRTATIDCQGNQAHSAQGPSEYTSLHVKCCYLTTKGDEAGILYDRGIRLASYVCENCTFTGNTSLWVYSMDQETTFKDCVFDFTNMLDDYAVYAYDAGYETKFSHCTFIGGGKGIKVCFSNKTSRTLTIEDCDFQIKERVKHKYVCEIDTAQTEAPFQDDQYWDIKIINCAKDDYFIDWYDHAFDDQDSHVRVQVI